MQITLLVFGMSFVVGALLVSSEITGRKENYYLIPLDEVIEKMPTRGGQISKRAGEYSDETDYQPTLWDSYYDAYPGITQY